jgi:hypothetical protein
MIRFCAFTLILLSLHQLLGCYADSIASSLLTQMVVRVESFGAKGDGISDDTKVISQINQTSID